MKRLLEKVEVSLFVFAVLAVLTFATARSMARGTFDRPDLIVEEIVFESSPSVLRVRVVNQGTAASSGCYLALASLMGDDPSAGTKQRVWTIPIPALEPGKGFSNTIDVAPLTQTKGPWRATVDRSNALAESNESNNSLTYPRTNSGPISLPRHLPDLVIDHFTLTDVTSGEVTVAVTNKGTSNSTECSLRLIVWEPGKFEHQEAKTVFVKVPAIHNGQTISVKAIAGVPIINTKYSLYIDISGQVIELDENNNRGEGEAGNYKP